MNVRLFLRVPRVLRGGELILQSALRILGVLGVLGGETSWTPRPKCAKWLKRA